MRTIPSILLLTATALLIALPPAHGQAPAAAEKPLIENGDFENPADPFKGWVTDYAFSGNSYYVGNKGRVTIATEGIRKNVAKFADAGDGGVKMECVAFPIEPGFRYVCNLDIKSGAYRLYFAGYQWLPGVRPHENPTLGELRMIYQSKAAVGSSNDWKREKFELPGIALSKDAIAHLRRVRYITVYIWMLKPGAIDNVTVTKVPDPAMIFP